MGIECGSQIAICDVPIRLDTYKGCTHGCRYCFVKRCVDISDVKPLNCIKQLKSFIGGGRTKITNWCDWDIPLHWGGMSDPFQPCEKKYRISRKALEVFEETGYPFIVSTKGALIADSEYLGIIENCNAIVQVSMIAPRYDSIEQGCPTYEERLRMLEKIAPNCKRLIVRIQPYTTDVLRDVLGNIPRLADSGAYGIIIEGMKSVKKVGNMVKVGGDYAYPSDVLRSHFQMIRDKAHENGLAFYSGENRLRSMGDSLTCCGCDGVDGFKANRYNLSHILNGDDVEPTDRMRQKTTGSAFRAIMQNSVAGKICDNSSMVEMMESDTYTKSFMAILSSDK